MRLAIVGTSNSIGPRGYVPGLHQSRLFTTIDNYSLGASTTVSLPYSLNRFEPNNYDFCVFDFAVNEHNQLVANPNEREHILGRLELISSRFAGSGCVPVILIMPCLSGFKRTAIGKNLYIDFARSNNLPYFGGYKFVKRIADGLKFPVQDCFRDRDHISTWASQSLGLILGEQILNLHRENIRMGVRTKDAYSFNYIRAAEVGFKAGEVVERKNSLISERFLHVENPRPDWVKFPASGKIIGVGLDASNTNVDVILRQGESCSRLSISRKYFNKTDAKTVFVITPLDGGINILKDEPCELDFISDQSADRSVLSLHGFVMQQQIRAVEQQRIEDDAVDMQQRVPSIHYSLIISSIGEFHKAASKIVA